ncbi:hypothetical protein CFC21_025497 [Triticum aestivum]|uniref:Uncharacterized protein n=2 Tax=Triticum aestivum TaxID=4565 RepID=A0A3B6CFJ2_WHEAT|nr:hypothetical protein CFC21_025497 [Triticum aestivum]
MAKAQVIARITVEVAPSIIRRRRRGLPLTVLDTIAEEEKEAAAAMAPHHRNNATACRCAGDTTGSSVHAGAEKGKRCVGGSNEPSERGEERLAPAKARCSKIAA